MLSPERDENVLWRRVLAVYAAYVVGVVAYCVAVYPALHGGQYWHDAQAALSDKLIPFALTGAIACLVWFVVARARGPKRE